MICKQVNDIINKIVDLLAGDKEIRTLLKNDKATAEDIVRDKMIVNYPVILNDNTTANFISIHHDNSIIVSNNIVSSYKISCGVSKDSWLTDNGDIRSLLIAERIESVLNNKRICDSTGPFVLNTINSIYWNELTTGHSLIFQTVEMDNINEDIL